FASILADSYGKESVTSLSAHISNTEGETATIQCPYTASKDISTGSQITQNDPSILKSEDETAELKCSFSTSSSSYWLHWYRQYPGEPLQFILFRGSGSHTADFAKDRFSSTADKSRGVTTLTVSRIVLRDSALYYCALQVHSDSADGIAVQKPARHSERAILLKVFLNTMVTTDMQHSFIF
ncbi:UNVERIFIED_CONTAM: hypothetical protein FKN15_026434, partial [Acipenser sinensis]